jgi:hypothetical protein
MTVGGLVKEIALGDKNTVARSSEIEFKERRSRGQ